jgi:phosphatidylserine/phosphatidylglycerophosphate/cardiolipin synthase-like enzyme
LSDPLLDNLIVPGDTVWRVERAECASLIIDAADYFASLRRAMLGARQQILMIGWDFDTRIMLDRETSIPGVPNRLGQFIHWLANNRPELNIHMLSWDMGAVKLLGRGSALFTALRWKWHKRITLRFDSTHPLGGAHHQKIVVIDDSFAICGGIDMTGRRWDTRAHHDTDQRRRTPSGRLHAPWHDMTMALAGPVAKALGELARDRWYHATSEKLPVPTTHREAWPKTLGIQWHKVDIGLARTQPARNQSGQSEQPAIREIEALYLRLINAARNYIYIENQYFASATLATALAKRLREADGPEIIWIMPESADGWLEEQAMGSARARLLQSLELVDHHRRLRCHTPVTDKGKPIYVHAKLMIIDDIILRVGSSNWNNRSLALDSECDVVLDGRLPNNSGSDQAIVSVRNDLLAEHLGCSQATVAQIFAETRSLIATIELLRKGGKTLQPFIPPELGEVATFIADNELLDPAKPDDLFEPVSGRGLFRRRKYLPHPDIIKHI